MPGPCREFGGRGIVLLRRASVFEPKSLKDMRGPGVAPFTLPPRSMKLLRVTERNGLIRFGFAARFIIVCYIGWSSGLCERWLMMDMLLSELA